MEIIIEPFKLCVIKNFLEPNFVLNEVRNEANRIKWNKRRLDLYEFWQTDDLVNAKEKYLKKVYDFLKTDVMPWVRIRS